MNIIIILLVCLFLIVLLLDVFPQFNTWQSRIHIGRITNKQDYTLLVANKALKWLKNTPTIKLTDNKRLIIIDILKGNYKRNAIQHWQEAALVLGLTESYYKTQNPEYKNQIDAFLKSKFNNYNWITKPTEIDGAILAFAILNCNWINQENYKTAHDEVYAVITNLIGNDGTVQYRSYSANFRFVDTIGFICPFLISYGLQFKNQKAIDLAVKQITTFNQFGMFNDTFIPCHTYNIETKLPVGLFGWGRGLGWYAIGLIDSWLTLPNENQNKKILEQSVVSFAKMALQFQNQNGSWSWIVLDNTSRMDSSTTATLAWFLVNAAQIDAISESCTIAKEKAIHYLMTVTRRDGAIDFSQGDTKAIGVHSQEFDILPFTQGFALRTLSK